MKKIAVLTGLITAVFIFLTGCSSSKQQNQESSLVEKETFTFDEIKSDPSAPLPIDSSDVEISSDEVKKVEIPSVTTRKKPMDSQESPTPAPSRPKITLPDSSASVANTPQEHKDTDETAQTGYYVQLGAFSSAENAKEFIRLNKAKIKGEMNIRFSERIKLYLVQLQPVESKIQAQNIAKELRKKGYKDVFVAEVVN